MRLLPSLKIVIQLSTEVISISHMSLKQIKSKIISTQKTGKVTKAMESVSAVKMRKSQERALQSRPYVRSAIRIFSKLAQTQDVKNHPITKERTTGTQLIVIVTSDKGLAGAVNSSVLKKVSDLIGKNNSENKIVAIGRKAVEFAQRENLEILSKYTNVSDGVSLYDVQEISSLILDTFLKDDIKKVLVVHQNFISTFEQEPAIRNILPIKTEELYKIMHDIVPKNAQTTDMQNDEDIDKAPIEYTIEPSPNEVIEALLPLLVQIIVYHALLESKASEHSARMVAMKNATDKTKEIVKSLTLEFNKARQAAITAEVSEITGGIEAMQQK